jgi:tetratricopeptide (TPR) repeat protein
MDDIRPRLEAALSGVYTFESELGGGGMSRTFLAREVALQRQVVVKVLAPELLAGISVERFRREVLLAAQLQHPHVVPVLTAGDIDGIPWFVMPYVDGDSLRRRLGRGNVGIGEAIGILRDVARALAYAHARGIVHRDIKPDNVLLSAGSATVTDFGIAKALSASRTGTGATRETLTQIGTSVGTPAYMAPEQAAGDPDTDHRADIYAFGVMAFELLAGRTPFVAATPTKLLAAHMGEQPPNLLEFRADCPSALADLVMRCLSKDPADRPHDASEMTRVLDTITSSGGGMAMPEILRGGRIRLGRAITLWAVALVVVAVTAWAAREVIGLPDWVLPGAVGVMLAGLPVLLLTAYVQRVALRAYTATPSRTPAPQGTMATLAMKASPHVSWRRTWWGGAIAVGGFAVLVIAFMVMRAMGIGPMASLRAQGTFDARERLMIADFRSPASDSTLGVTVSEALRTDLAQSASLDVLSRSAIREALTLMQRPTDTPVPFELAREIATREGAKALLDGAISQIGQTYVIAARLVSALDGSDLAVFREEAANEDEILAALGRLSKNIRSKTGESLRSVRASTELDRVTTPSLPALRKYVEGIRLADEAGEFERGIAMLREAVALDTSFAMAWRKLATLLGNSGMARAEQITALSTAYRHRDRLTDMERLLTEGSYFMNGPDPDRDRAIAAYAEAARLDTLSTAALNNTAVLLGQKYDDVQAESLYRRVIALPRTFGGAFTNLIQEQIINGRSSSAIDSTVRLFNATMPDASNLWEADWFAAWGRGDLVAADSIARAMSVAGTTMSQRVQSRFGLAGTMELRGRLAEAEKWALSADMARLDEQPSTIGLLTVSLDSAWFEMRRGSKDRALAVIARGLERAPMAQIAPAERPWQLLAALGGLLAEPRLAREALIGYERDQAALAFEPAGGMAQYTAWVAFAEARWQDVITATTDAERYFEMDRRAGAALRGIAYQGLNRPDSAAAAFERFLALRDPLPLTDGSWKAEVLRRLGEAYEEVGDRAKAIERYEQFVALWADADPELQPQVRDVRARVAKLKAAGG